MGAEASGYNIYKLFQYTRRGVTNYLEKKVVFIEFDKVEKH